MHTPIIHHKAGPTTSCPCPPDTHPNKKARDHCEIIQLIATMISDLGSPPSPSSSSSSNPSPVNPHRSTLAIAEILSLAHTGPQPPPNKYPNDSRFRLAVARFELRCPASAYSAKDFIFIPHGRFITGRVKYYYFWQLRMLFGDMFMSVEVMLDAFHYTPGDLPRGILAYWAAAASVPLFRSDVEAEEREEMMIPERRSRAIAIVDPDTLETRLFASPITTAAAQVQAQVPVRRRGKCAIAIVKPLASTEGTTPDREGGKQAVKMRNGNASERFL